MTGTCGFLSHLESNGEPKFEVDSVDYRIVTTEKLKTLMSEAGFKRLKLYGDYEFAQFRDDHSEDTVAIGTK